MSQKLVCLLGLVFLAGCQSAVQINKAYSRVSSLQNINDRDAIIIAQKHVLDYGRKSINVSSAVIEDDDTTHPVYWHLRTKVNYNQVWIVRFRPKIGSISYFRGLTYDYRYYVVVDRVTGFVLDKDWGLANRMRFGG